MPTPMANCDTRPGRYQLIGMQGSPYSVKLRAILRYRRLEFDWVQQWPQLSPAPPPVKPLVIPILRFPEDGSHHIDSTPLAYELERRHPGERSIIPADAAMAFLAALFEDMADEWCTKMMFHCRWRDMDSIAYAINWLASDALPNGSREERSLVAKMLSARQVSRRDLVGCTEQNLPAIEASFLRVSKALDAHIDAGEWTFLFGTRPSLADFGIYGQFVQLATDPAPAARMRNESRNLFDWLRRVDDLSGLEGDWVEVDRVLASPVVNELAAVAGDTYLPFLVANSEALRDGRSTFSVALNGRPYAQQVFKYQEACLVRLKTLYRQLDDESRAVLNELMKLTGCLPHLDTGIT